MTYGIDLVNYAEQFTGTPYVWGGNDLKSGVDCSGLVQQVYKQYGIDLPRTTYDQINEGKAVNMKGLKPGDLVFFDTDKTVKGPDHVGIYIGDGKMIHAPRPGKGVEVASITDSYYASRFVAGRRIDGVKNSGTSPDDYASAADIEDQMTPEELASNYGYTYAFLESNAGLKEKFDQAVKETWSPEKFAAEIMSTDWYKQNSESMRKAAVQKASDPATWSATVDAVKAKISKMASDMGAPIDAKTLTKISNQVALTSDSDEQIQATLSKYIDFVDKNTLVGKAGIYQNNIKKYAYLMGVPVDDQSIKDQAARIAKGVSTEQDFQDLIRQQAKSNFPQYSDAIDAGSTVAEIANPYLQTMSDELELNSASISLTDPLIKKALNGLDKDGKPSGMDLPTFTAQLRNDPRWSGTQKAQNNAMNAGLKVLSDMGLIAANGYGRPDQQSLTALPNS